jgi:hypothetical protein
MTVSGEEYVSNPVLITLTYLPLREQAEIEEWVIAPFEDFQGPWLSPEFETRSTQLLARIEGAVGEPVKRPTIIARKDTGASGVPPSRQELSALQAAVDFAAVSMNPEWSSEAAMAFAYSVVTTDNTEIQCWPLNLESGYVAFDTGLLNATLHGGLNLDKGSWLIPRPLEVVIPSTAALDVDLATAVYNIGLQIGKPEKELERRILIALHWWSKAWRNSPSLAWPDRIVFLKTAFEALTDESSTPKAAAALEGVLAKVADSLGIEVLDLKDFLWSPDEAPRLERTWRDKSGHERKELLTDLQHWFNALGQARNAIIHEGSLSVDLNYEQAGSRYSGPLFHSAERVLRESVRLILSELGFPDVWRDQLGRASVKMAEALENMRDRD